jgi:predicted CXXCH cytochrome family protein
MFSFITTKFVAIQLLCFTGMLAFSGCGKQATPETSPRKAAEQNDPGAFLITHNAPRLAKIGPDACVNCHADEVEDWKRSHHAKANRPVSVERDRAAFTPTRWIKESGVTYQLVEENEAFYLRVIKEDGSTVSYDLVGVIGETPLRQYLAHTPGNKFQTISATYDVLNDSWVDVFAGEDRMPGEWGHWTGQGMNWNSNCAYCHTTEYQKGFDFKGNAYHSTWVQQGLACAECHTGLAEHVEAAQVGDNYRGLTKLTTPQTEHNCVTCHSRRDQLTSDAFKTGDDYHDHFSLSLPDQQGLYYADGQILDEVFVYGSFEMSRMAHAGVSCMDCHNPHTLENTLPVENNMLCMRCHEAGGTMEAPIIEPMAHSFHAEGSTGNRCVECHMPKTTYMQVDPRADHGFHSPDPLMTKELGIPNACSTCHDDKSLDWAVEHAEKWYGEKLAKSRQRQRAHAISDAYQYLPEALPALLELAKDEEIAAWRATYAGLVANYLPNEAAESHLRNLLDDESALVRTRAIGGISTLADSADTLIEKLSDSSRSVRIAAARGLSIGRGQDIPESKADAEWQAYLKFNADRPQSLFMLASEAAREGNATQVQTYLARAILLDSVNPEIYHQAAILLSSAKLNEAATRYLYAGWELAPQDAIFPYSLGLLAAEAQDLEAAIGFLEETVAMEPQFYRAWYNLSLAYSRVNRTEDAQRAMQKARGE